MDYFYWHWKHVCLLICGLTPRWSSMVIRPWESIRIRIWILWDMSSHKPILGFGGLFHATLGPSVIATPLFAYQWQDKNQMTSILGIHLVILSCGSFYTGHSLLQSLGDFTHWLCIGGLWTFDRLHVWTFEVLVGRYSVWH